MVERFQQGELIRIEPANGRRPQPVGKFTKKEPQLVPCWNAGIGCLLVKALQ